MVADSYDYDAEFTLTGIMESNFLGYTGGHILGVAGQGSGERLLPADYLYYNVDIRTEDKKNFQAIMDDLCSRLKMRELDTLYNIPLLNALGIDFDRDSADSDLAVEDAGFSWMMAVGVLVVLLLLLAAGLVIYNILKITVTKRIRQYGTLRAIGAGRGQLYKIVAYEVLLLCMAGIPVGLLLGSWSVQGILTAALNQLPPEIFLAKDREQLQIQIAENCACKWGHLLLSTGITLMFSFLAAAPAVLYAGRVSPVTAMSGLKGRIKRRRRSVRKIRYFERYYAKLNLRRNPGRTAVTILSLIMSITVFITLQGFLFLLGVAGGLSEHLGDYAIVSSYTGISPEDVQTLKSDGNVEEIAAQQFTLYELDGNHKPVDVETDLTLGVSETFQIFGQNDFWVAHKFASRLTKEQLEMLQAGEGCVIRNPIPLEIEGETFCTTYVEEGSTITVAGKKLKVLLSMGGYDDYFSVENSGFTNGVQVLVSDRLYPKLTGTDAYVELRPVLQNDGDREAFDRILKEFTQKLPGATMISYEQTDRQFEESEAQIKLLAWGLILFIGLIVILNIINTVYTNIHTRLAEIGTQRALGMSIESLYKIFLWEGIYYGIIAAVIGGIAGYISTVFLEAATTNVISLPPFPIVPAICATALSIGACMLATCVPLGKISRINIVDAIETIEGR